VDLPLRVDCSGPGSAALSWRILPAVPCKVQTVEVTFYNNTCNIWNIYDKISILYEFKLLQFFLLKLPKSEEYNGEKQHQAEDNGGHRSAT
jgi:hypothetical protein